MYVLILVVSTFQSGYLPPVVHDFSSQAACVTAGAAALKASGANTFYTCTPK